MSGNSTLQTVLELILSLSSGLNYTVKDIQVRFKLTERTTYRYLEVIKNAGFIVEKTPNHFYYINKKSPYFTKWFTFCN